MTILSDADLVRMYPGHTVGPASIDLHLGNRLDYWPDWVRRDPRIDQSGLWKRAALLSPNHDPHWVLEPGLRYLAATRERVMIRPDLAGQILGRSSWGRDGLAAICGPAGFLDPGFEGLVVLELSVVGSQLVVRPGDAVCQLIFHRLETPSSRPYGHPDRASKYQGQDGVTPSRYHLEAVS